MDDHIIKAADECGIPISKTFGPMIGACPVGDVLERFYALAFKAGMEKAAEIADAMHKECHPIDYAYVIRVYAQNQPKNVHDSSVV